MLSKKWVQYCSMVGFLVSLCDLFRFLFLGMKYKFWCFLCLTTSLLQIFYFLLQWFNMFFHDLVDLVKSITDANMILLLCVQDLLRLSKLWVYKRVSLGEYFFIHTHIYLYIYKELNNQGWVWVVSVDKVGRG